MTSIQDKRVSFLQYLNTFLLMISLALLGIGVNQMIIFNEKYTTTEKKVDKLEIQQSYQTGWAIERDRLNTDEHKRMDERLDYLEAMLPLKKNYKQLDK